MYQPLVPCPGCRRHVRTTENACPFCSEALVSAELARAVMPGTTLRLSRAAAFVFGASLAIAAVDCGGDTENQTGSATNGTGGDGGDDGSGGAGNSGGIDDGGAGQPLYGDPGPIDAGTDAPDDDGGFHAEYGGPAPVDAGPDGPDDDGGVQAEYGAPAP